MKVKYITDCPLHGLSVRLADFDAVRLRALSAVGETPDCLGRDFYGNDWRELRLRGLREPCKFRIVGIFEIGRAHV